MSRGKKNKDDLPAYNSGDEGEAECALCLDTTNDPVQFGKWISFEHFKVHQLCCVGIFSFPRRIVFETIDSISHWFCLYI